MGKNRLLVEQLRINPATKQPILISGETIKTINSINLLGSGNITVITDISMKQDNLISGTNIKTINGSSILGSGNITVITDISMKQDNLISGTNIKTINNQDITGSGNIDIVIPVPNVYIQSDDPSASVPIGTSALWIQKMPNGTFAFNIIEN